MSEKIDEMVRQLPIPGFSRKGFVGTYGKTGIEPL
jgi:hypothetical protein